MLNKIGIIIFLWIYCFNCDSQTNVYHPFPDSNAVWTEFDQHWTNSSVCPNSSSNPLFEDYHLSYHIGKDTTINSIIYHKIFKSGTKHTHCWDGFNMNSNSLFNYYAGAIRQDIPAKKIYFIVQSANQEIVLYDFNLNIGSVVNCMTVTTIDSVLIGNSYNKRFGFSLGSARLIEGMGYSVGLLEPLCPFEESSNLICFSKNGQTLYPNTSTTCLIITNNKENIKLKSWTIFPNPNSGTFRLKVDSEMDMGLIVLTNYLGQKIHQQNIETGENIIELIGVSQGLYNYSILNGKQILSNGKVSVQ